MDDISIPQPKEIVTTVSARCANCGTVWDISRIVERRDENDVLVEEENVSSGHECPSCHPNPMAPAADEVAE